tara:strand:+ start:217 stop:399 length:183 start_codon:yes stop_codon:yes gene_type:complete
LVRAAVNHNIPFILSTAGIERIGKITEGKAWFQLYHPTEEAVKRDLLERAEAVGTNVCLF